ncbi:MAG TPA: hydroxymethylbilane synthase [Vicinamibacterales bacterium]
MTAPLRIGTRGSALALWQARTVAALLETRGTAVEIVVIKTEGDRLQDAPLTEAGNKGLFVKEIEEALLEGRVDLAVHSAKDMPAVSREALAIAAVLPREDSRDALVLPGAPAATAFEIATTALGPTPSIGTGSVRRIAQLAVLVPGARFQPIRGNVDTRLRKLDAGDFDAIVLASAGLRRLGLGARISAAIPHAACIPAPGQGIVAIQIRRDDAPARRAVAPLNDALAGASLEAERAVVAALGGGCRLPLGAVAVPSGDELEMRAIVASPDGGRRVTRSGRGPLARPAELGRRIAEDLAKAGAIAILDEVR